MTEVTYEVVGLREVDRNLEALSEMYGKRNAVSAFRAPIREALKPVFMAIKNNTPVDTGALRDSTFISITVPTQRQISQSRSLPRNTIIQGSVGWRWTSAASLSRTALATEFGNSKTAAQPVITPAFEANIRQINSTISERLQIGLDRAAVRLARSFDKGKLVIK